jgi:adenosylcobinamide kinase/adenosylcobinamide-phosphate guanylyltransferase
MANIIFITGGQRSGKSNYAQRLAEELSAVPVYLATARVWDTDFKDRITRHQADRGEQWTTIEEEKHLSKHSFQNKTVVLDCITLWLTNFYHDTGYDHENALAQAKKEWDAFIKQDFTLIVISNELGMGVHPPDEKARKFADIQGWMNQHIAQQANKVVLMVSGIPMTIK